MGGQPYWYFVDYEADVRAALDRLRQREFAAGRYSPVLPFMDFDDPESRARAPGPAHSSIEEAFEAAAEGGEGTRSILDVDRVAPTFDFGAAAPFDHEFVRVVFGTATPSRAAVEERSAQLVSILERGQCGYLIVYEGDRPSQIWFAGYSYD